MKKCLIGLSLFCFANISLADEVPDLAEGQSVIVCNDTLVGTIERAVQDLNYRLMRNPIVIDYPPVTIRLPFKVSAPTIFSDPHSGTKACVTISK